VDKILEQRLAAVAKARKHANDDAAAKGLPPVAKNSTEIIEVEHMPTGSPSLDIQLFGGWPKGNWVEIFGKLSSGKSTLAYGSIAEYHRRDPYGIALIVDLENTFDLGRAVRMGVDPDRLEYLGPNTAEDTFEAVEYYLDLVDGGKAVVGLIVLDSIAALMAAAEEKSDISDVTVASSSRVLGRVYRRFQGKLYRNGTVFIMINQIRAKIGGYGPVNTTTPGGFAPGFFSSVRIESAMIKRIVKTIKKKDVELGVVSKFSVRKNKSGGGLTPVELTLTRARGLDAAVDIVTSGIEYGVIAKSGGGLSVTLADGTEISEKSEQDMLVRIRGDRALFGELYDRVVVTGIEVTKKNIGLALAEVDAEPDVDMESLDKAESVKEDEPVEAGGAAGATSPDDHDIPLPGEPD